LPTKDDSDTEKFKNFLRLQRGTSSQSFKEKILKMWGESKEKDNIRCAWVVNHPRLLPFMVDLYSILEFERGSLLNVSLLYQNWSVHFTGVSFILLF